MSGGRDHGGVGRGLDADFDIDDGLLAGLADRRVFALGGERACDRMGRRG